jgi:hypothetical protein
MRNDMIHRHAFIALGCALVVSVCAGTLVGAGSQEGSTPAAAVQAVGRVAISGTSNIHPYTASTTTLRVVQLRFAPSLTDPAFLDEIVKPEALTAFEVAIPAATLTSPKEGIDKNMHKALKVDAYPDITFRLMRLERGDAPDVLHALGTLQIAGVSREVALNLAATQRGGAVSVKGELQLLMTDYGVTPPKALMGMLKTDPKVTVTFETTLSAPLT